MKELFGYSYVWVILITYLFAIELYRFISNGIKGKATDLFCILGILLRVSSLIIFGVKTLWYYPLIVISIFLILSLISRIISLNIFNAHIVGILELLGSLTALILVIII